MNIVETSLPGVKIIEPKVFGDNRGWFVESFNDQRLKEAGIDTRFVQDNHSMSATKGTLRGLHFQNNPKAQAKLIRCTRGSMLDVIVDIQSNSPTYKEWIAIELSAENKRMIFIPKGFAHGFLTLDDNTELQYKVDEYYSPEHDRSIRFDDPDLNINWNIEDPVLSEKDKSAPFLLGSDCNF